MPNNQEIPYEQKVIIFAMGFMEEIGLPSKKYRLNDKSRAIYGQLVTDGFQPSDLERNNAVVALTFT